jgi:DNA-binding NtrC family response regulator
MRSCRGEKQQMMYSVVVSRTALDRAIDALIANPYRPGAVSHTDAGQALAKLDVVRALHRLVEEGDVARAEALVVAAGHHEACVNGNDPARVLGRSTLPEGLRRHLPRGRGAYLRIAMAAGRCHAALDALKGSSSELRRVRAETWAACFGENLVHALVLQRVIFDHDVLILGETGTGKESVARAIQQATPGDEDGRPAPAAAINAAAVPETLVESALFGHVKGAYTGAMGARPGLLKTADGGAFFLDEVGDLPTTTQVKLLRVIEENEMYPVGADTPVEVNCRYLAATHKDLERMVERGEFRRDLFERLAGNVIRLPPLREHPGDVIEIGQDFVARCAPHAPARAVAAVERWLASPEPRSYAWPGNTRELQNVLRNLLLGLPPGLKKGAPAAGEVPATGEALPPVMRDCAATLEQVEHWYMRRVVGRKDGNLAAAARTLGVDRSTLKRRLGAGSA